MPSPFDGLHAIGADETSYRKGYTHVIIVVDHERLRAASPADAGSFGWAVLGFFIPLVGLILWMIWKNDRPRDAGMAGRLPGTKPNQYSNRCSITVGADAPRRPTGTPRPTRGAPRSGNMVVQFLVQIGGA